MDKKILIHISDIHIRGYQYIDEIEFSFNELYRKIDETIKSNQDAAICIVCTGDVYHSKLTVTNEYFNIALKFFRELANRAPLVIIPGNHDLSLPNKDRLDAISPVINAIYGSTKFDIHYSTKSERWQGHFLTGEFESVDIGFYFHHFAITDEKSKWPTKKNFHYLGSKLDSFNVALYHGSINNSKVDSGWTSRGNHDDISLFSDFDMAMLGDIHVSQMLTPTIGYAGSLRQNNFGETLDKGYLEWTIQDRKISTKRVILEQKRYFLTLNLSTLKEVENLGELPSDCRIKVKPQKEIDIVEEIKIKNKIQELYSPYGEVEIAPPETIEKLETAIEIDDELDVMHENIRDIEVQKSLIKKFYENKDLKKEDFEDLFEIDKKYHSFIKNDLIRNIKWNITEMKWDNLFSYGKGNSIDFKKLNGITAIVGRNGSGKSGILDILNFGIFNSIIKEGANKNFDYINWRCKNANVSVNIKFNDDLYLIDKTIKKIGKTDAAKVDNEIDFNKLDKDKVKKCLNGETKPDTSAAIRNIFGTSDDFAVTSLSSQFGLTRFIDARGTERKKTISKFLDLDIFEEKYQLAIEHFKDIKSQLKLFDLSKLMKELESFELEIDILKIKETKLDAGNKNISEAILNLNEIILENSRKLFNFEFNSNEAEILEELKKQTNHKELKLEQANKLAEDLELKINLIKELNKQDLQKRYIELGKLNLQIDRTMDMIDSSKKTSLLIAKIPNESICKKCPLAKNAYDAQILTNTLTSTLEKLNQDFSEHELNDLQKKLNIFEVLDSNKREIVAATEAIELIEEKIVKLNQELDLCRQNKLKIKENNVLEEQIRSQKENKKDLEREFVEKAKELKELQRRMAVLEANILNHKEKIENVKVLSRQHFLYQLYIEAMGKDGISYWIISKKIPIINRILNKILCQIWNLKIELVNDEEEKTLKIKCSDDDGKRTIELLSGAEKAVAALALRTAFWYISSLPKSPILILDEAFSFIENDKMDSVMKALSYLKNYFENIILITHNDELKSYCDHVLYVNKTKGYSKIGE